MKKLVNLGKVLNKEEQKEINGGRAIVRGCGGCSDTYLCPYEGASVCAFPDANGNTCFGTYTPGGPCCV